MSEPASCRLCGGVTSRLFAGTVLGRHSTEYRQCPACGLTQTDEPTWLSEAYAEPISVADTGLVDRNLHARALVATFLHLAGVRDQPCVDYAGGYGLFTRLMRDAGFQFRWTDPYTPNLFARGFEWSAEHGRPFAVTAFEVLEHFARPRDEFRRIAAIGAELVIASTEVYPGERPAPDWPYLSRETGQHVAFYRSDTLRRLGESCGYPHVVPGRWFHLFARARPPLQSWALAVRWGKLLFPWIRRLRGSLTESDCEAARERLRGR